MLKSSMPNTVSPGLLAQKLESVFRSGNLSNNGPVVQRLENEVLPEVLELKDDQAIALVSNGTVALELCAPFVGPYIIVPAYTFCATVLPFAQENRKVYFADVDDNGLICTDSIDSIYQTYGINPVMSTIIGVDLFGQSCGPRLERFVKQGARVLIDAAQSFGVYHRTNYNHLRTYSFHATKTIHCCEGGAIVGPKVQVDRIKKARAFGGVDDPFPSGTNAKLDEIRATILEHNLSNAWDVLHHNGHLIDYVYRAILPYKHFKAYANRYALLEIKEYQLRQNILEALEAENIHLRNYFEALNGQPRFRNVGNGHSCLGANKLDFAFISLPLGWDVKPEQAEKVAWICAEQINKY